MATGDKSVMLKILSLNKKHDAHVSWSATGRQSFPRGDIFHGICQKCHGGLSRRLEIEDSYGA